MTNTLKITSADVNGMFHPIGIDDQAPTFHYLAEGAGEHRRVTAHQAQVLRNGALLWDSGKAAASDGPISATRGALRPKTTYQVRLRVWDEEDVPSDLCPPVTFETGFLGEAWIGRWIEPEQEDAVQEEDIGFFGMLNPNESFFNGQTRLREAKDLSKTFELPEVPVTRARLYATAHGVYDLTLNGVPVSDRRLAPETTRYDRILYYQTYDVLPQLQKGENTLGVTLADGWWIGRLGMAGDSCNYGNRLGFLMQLELEFADGTSRTICSDRSFRSRSSRVRYSDLYIGEKQDQTFVPGPWQPCREVEFDNRVLVGQFVDPMTVLREAALCRTLRTPKGELVLDFGQVLSGVVRLELDAPTGTVVTLDHGEVLDRDGNFKSNIGGRCKNQQDVVICAGGRQIFEPRFTYHGFRYVRLTGVSEEQIRSAAARVIGTPLRKIGFFETDNDMLDQLQHNIEWSTISNMDSVPTDCPQREKLGWTGDIQVFSPTGGFLYDLRSFLSGWLRQVRADQYPDGQIPVVVPNHPSQERLQMGMSGENSSSVWSDCCILVPLTLYRLYGDKRVLEENFEMMKRWLGYVADCAAREPEGYENFTPEQKARNPYLWTKGYHFGDWLIPSLRERPDGIMLGVAKTAAVVGASFYAVSVAAFVEVCEALGETELAAAYAELLPRIRAAVRDEFVAEDGTVNGCDLQGLYVMILKSGACEGELKQKVLRRLVGLIEANGGRLDTGFSSVSYLLDMLYENGCEEEAYRLLYQTEAPSWLYMVKQGATTLWENWKATLEDGTTTDSSYNHYAFGCVGDWMYRRMGGICALEPGYRRVRIQPDFRCGLHRCDCRHGTPYGEVGCHWERANGQLTVTVTVPVNVEAEVVLGGETHRVGSGTYTFRTAV